MPESSSTVDSPAPKAASLVAAQIRKQIVMGELAEGDTLPSEAEMVKRLGVSRPTLRQAFRILETEHLIVVQRGSRGGGTVFRPSTKLAGRYLSDLLRYRTTTLRDVLAAQLMIEPAAVGQVARDRDDDIVERLQKLVSEGAGEDGAAESAGDFHVELVSLVGNPVLTEYCELIHLLIRAQTRSMRLSQLESPGGTESHRAVVELIAAGASHAASQHWRQHLLDLHAELGKLVDLDSVLQPPD